MTPKDVAAVKGLTIFTDLFRAIIDEAEMNSDQTAMGLPPLTLQYFP
jgi:hypothetical protein